jgi:hypothetical protein
MEWIEPGGDRVITTATTATTATTGAMQEPLERRTPRARLQDGEHARGAGHTRPKRGPRNGT